MPQYQEHINQAKSNLAFLEAINVDKHSHLDWKVTVCYYVAVHLINAHLAIHKMQFRTHVNVKAAISPKDPESIAAGSALGQAEYVAYVGLQMLSRRSRYLVNEKDNQLASQKAQITYDVHYSKALRHLNVLITYFNTHHNTQINPISIVCNGIKHGELQYLHPKKEAI